MNIKIEEKLFSSDLNYDKKHKLNLSKKHIDMSSLNDIENGVSIEYLENIKLPICKYKTQITIHGNFPAESINVLNKSRYKYIFQNKNQSIGIKYNAIDWHKKMKIDKYIRAVKDCIYTVHYNSSFFALFSFSKYFQDKEQARQEYKKYKDIFDNIDKSLFIGNANILLCRCPWGRGYYIALKIDISAIYQKNLNAFIENITGKTLADIDDIIKVEEEQDEKERAAMTADRKKEEAKAQILYNDNLNYLKSYAGKELIATSEPGLYLIPAVSGFKKVIIIKEPRQKKKRYYKTESFKTITEAKAAEIPQDTYFYNKINNPKAKFKNVLAI